MAKKLDEMFPSEIVASLDKYIIGQAEAKKMIAIALRNRTRRKKLDSVLREEVTPKNILMIGPTGVGKTEIARRIARLANAPFIKVEATKYTEVGYVGRDVESMVKDLMASAVNMVNDEMAKLKEEDVSRAVNEQFRQMLHNGVFEDKLVEMNVTPSSRVEIGVLGNGNSMDDIQEAMNSLGSIFQRPKKKKISIKRAREIIREEETAKAVDRDKVLEEAKIRTEEMGIIFIDEIDKIASGNRVSSGEVSREGVQRDILPIVEGTRVNTKWGVIDTTNILFIASGAFSMSKPSDLIPELQGRFPIRVELSALSVDDFYRILTEPENALTKQYAALLATEGVTLDFREDGLRRVAEIAYQVNGDTDNIGARRLHTVMEKLLEDVSFKAEEYQGQTIAIDRAYVDERLDFIASNEDVSRYIL